ncbi:ribosomal protein L7/L12 [Asaccharospora irregularis]|uniref:Ribosomal protein L7/L12 C-terminal domain-containing protein n=1 Tax=Asaccharospora irregularis DSM 2635 TaxID=1121321 RepID=A0A1M5SMS8_9FIRM|nr:Ribosomal protein L7/L12 C-terminal domain-containing protein [Asaccharospora irregularis DSM 2635]
MNWFIAVTLMWLVINVGHLQNNIDKVNKKLDKISKQVGVSNEISDVAMDELKVLIEKGQKVKAIKEYRVATGVGLKEAKEYIDLLSEDMKK